MQNFLSQSAGFIYGKHKDELDKIGIVLPNQRANLFLKKHFSELLDDAVWAPKFISIEDFIIEISDLQIIDNIDLLFELYAIHRELQSKDPESMEEFSSWGNIMLYDFNELDRYMVDAENLYSTLSEIHALQAWNLDGRELSDFQKNYLNFWSKLGDYYALLREKLLAKGKAYQGLAYRVAAEKIEKANSSTTEFKKIYFVGFNAFTRAEEKIIKKLVDDGKASMLWDADEYYIKDNKQEAGDFLRPRWKENPESFLWLFDDLKNSSKKINISGVAGNIAQVKLAANFLKKHQNSQKLSNTAIVLADENLLLPLLQSLPQNIDKANITMGLPLNSTPLYRFFNDLFQLFLNLERLNTEKKDAAFYYKDLLKVLTHSSINSIYYEVVNKINNELLQNKIFFISKNTLAAFEWPGELKMLFDIENSKPGKLVNCILSFIDVLKESPALVTLEKEYLFQFTKIFNRLKDLLNTHSDFAINQKALYSLFNQISSQSSISFFGEPLQGLQIMGVLESRTLDFENVILLSVNEGVLPSGKSQNSFIPYDIKRKFALPSYKEKDSIFAYHFYRLLQRSKEVELIYNTQADALHGSEESRFIKQLLQELPQKNKNIQIENRSIKIPISKKAVDQLSIEKDESLLLKIREHLQYGISPSALSTFVQCPLDYYYKYILKLSEKKEVQEILQTDSFGSIVHRTLQLLYLPQLDKKLNLNIIENIKTLLPKTLSEVFEMEFKADSKTGKNHLVFQVALQYIYNFLEFEEKRVIRSDEGIVVLDLEKKLECDWIMSFGEEEINIKLKGTADRIEKEGNIIRIIDYKTGSVKENELSYASATDMLEAKKAKALQLCIYSVMYQSMDPAATIVSSIFSLKNHNSELMSYQKMEKGITEAALLEAKEILEMAFKELLNPHMELSHSQDSLYCDYCT